MQLRQFARDDHVLRSPEDGLNIREGVQKAVWRFIKNMRHLTPNELFERGLPLARLCWKKAVEGESLRWEATRDQAADRSICAGNWKDVNSGGDGRSSDLSAWICNSRGASIADDCNPCAPLQLCRELLRARALVVHVIAHGRRVNLEVIQQLLCLPRVLAGDAVHAAEDTQGSQADVFQIS